MCSSGLFGTIIDRGNITSFLEILFTFLRNVIRANWGGGWRFADLA